MTTVTVSKARSQLCRLIDQTVQSHKPIQITGKRNSGVLISEEDWRSIEETLYILSIPGMRQSIEKGHKTPISKCVKKLIW